jgi:hypothetical protein
MVTTCSNCGYDIKQESRFCGKCGSVIPCAGDMRKDEITKGQDIDLVQLRMFYIFLFLITGVVCFLSIRKHYETSGAANALLAVLWTLMGIILIVLHREQSRHLGLTRKKESEILTDETIAIQKKKFKSLVINGVLGLICVGVLFFLNEDAKLFVPIGYLAVGSLLLFKSSNAILKRVLGANLITIGAVLLFLH